MQSSFKRFSVIAGFAVLLIVLIGNGLLTRREVSTQIASEVAEEMRKLGQGW